MKKIISFFITSILAVCAFSFGVFADDFVFLPSCDTSVSEYVSNYTDPYDDTHPSRLSQSMSSMRDWRPALSQYYFVYMTAENNAVIFMSNVSTLCFDSEHNRLYAPDNAYISFMIGSSVDGSTSMNEMSSYYLQFPSDFDFTKLHEYTNMTLDGVPHPFDPNSPPDVFTYSIDKPNFSLVNGENGKVNVTISYTAEYIDWVQRVKQFVNPDFVGSYNFILYVSSVKPTDLTSLINSLQDMVYVKLTYDDYIQMSEWRSHLNFDINRGATISFTFDPLQNQSLTLPILAENIRGTDTHVNGYVSVLGAYCDGFHSPDVFTSDWFVDNLQNGYFDKSQLALATLSGSVSPNDRLIEYNNTRDNNGIGDTIINNTFPTYRVHQFYIPYDCVNNCVCDLYGGGYTYKKQTVNNKDYDTPTSTDDFVKNTNPDFKQHSQMSDKSIWLKPSDYKQYYEDWQRKHTYGEDFDFNGETLKDVFSKEGDFFKFIGSALSVFPSYVMDIFVAFLVGMLVVVLLKFIL